LTWGKQRRGGAVAVSQDAGELERGFPCTRGNERGRCMTRRRGARAVAPIGECTLSLAFFLHLNILATCIT